jgi:D-cysteine desulfhydrase
VSGYGDPRGRNLVSADVNDELPLLRRFPALRSVPRVELCNLPTPVQSLAAIAPELWVKRDDLNADRCGGNKARSLEFLLGPVCAGDVVLTVGGAGSTHVLATALHAQQLGARTVAERWRHDMNPTATRVATRIASSCESRMRMLMPVALAHAYVRGRRRGVRYVPLGGSIPLGILAHVNAGLELLEQIEAGALPEPSRIVLPLGTGGTAAGIALAMAIARVDAVTCGARVAARVAANRWRVLRLARHTASFIERLTGERLPPVKPSSVSVVHNVYGGAYGRPLARADAFALELREAYGIELDETYSAKAFVAARELALRDVGPTLFWLTFDARCLNLEGK